MLPCVTICRIWLFERLSILRREGRAQAVKTTTLFGAALILASAIAGASAQPMSRPAAAMETIAEERAEIAQDRAEVKSEIAAVRAQVQATAVTREQIRAIRAALRAKLAALHH